MTQTSRLCCPQQDCRITMKQKKSKQTPELPEYQMSISALRSSLLLSIPLSLSLSYRFPLPTLKPPPIYLRVPAAHLQKDRCPVHLFKGADTQSGNNTRQEWNYSHWNSPKFWYLNFLKRPFVSNLYLNPTFTNKFRAISVCEIWDRPLPFKWYAQGTENGTKRTSVWPTCIHNSGLFSSFFCLGSNPASIQSPFSRLELWAHMQGIAR